MRDDRVIPVDYGGVRPRLFDLHKLDPEYLRPAPWPVAPKMYDALKRLGWIVEDVPGHGRTPVGPVCRMGFVP